MANADTTVFVWLNGLTGAVGLIDSAARIVGSDYAVPAVMGLTILAMWFVGGDAEDRMRRQVGVFVALTAVGLASWMVFAGNELYFRPRPFDAALGHDVTVLLYRPTDSSFPSNSAAVAFAAAGGVWLISRRAGLALFGVAVAYGLARVYGGVHYPLDIVGGAIVGLVAVVMARGLWRLIDPVARSRHTRRAHPLHRLSPAPCRRDRGAGYLRKQPLARPWIPQLIGPAGVTDCFRCHGGAPCRGWIPAFAGMTEVGDLGDLA